MPRAFVIRPFGRKKDNAGQEIDFEAIHDALIGPALAATGVSGDTTGEIVEPGNIRSDMFSAILAADVVICDITIHNANVFYELGIRHALRKRSTVLLRGHPIADKIPFDLITDRYIEYSIANAKDASDELEDAIKNALETERESDSPVFLMLPSLMEADPDASNWIVPKELSEDVQLAQDAQSIGWLRLLASEVKGQLFESKGLALIAEAQLRIGDLEGALESWEAIREADALDAQANLSLANVYERLYRRDKNSSHLTKSEQAVDRILSSKPNPALRAEAMALKARNQKTRWRERFEDADTVEERRALALRPELLSSYEYYRQAFLSDLNAYWPGLAALQMGTIIENFADESSDWPALFETDREARVQREEIIEEVTELQYLVRAAVEANVAQGRKIDVWLQVTQADVLFLTSDRLPRVLHAYERAIPKHEAYAWESARGQLELFRDLGVRHELASKVIDMMDRQLGSTEIEAVAEETPQRVILFAGHRIENSDDDPYLPLVKDESRAKALIRSQLETLVNGDPRVEAFAPATPGANILFHEVCQELGLQSTLCLPVRRRDYARTAFGSLDGWKSRFLALAQQRPVLELSGTVGLPSWLEAAGIDQWERGNRWVLEHSLTRQAESVHLLALWDGTESRRSGDTDHMIALARQSGLIAVQIIDAKQLLE